MMMNNRDFKVHLMGLKRRTKKVMIQKALENEFGFDFTNQIGSKQELEQSSGGNRSCRQVGG